MKSLKPLIIAAALIISVASFLRFTNLNSLPVFADESIYVRWSQVMRAESTLRFLPLSDGKQPLYMWLVIAFLKLFSDPLLAGRVVSGLAGIATVVATGLAAHLLFGKLRLSLIAAAVWAVLPYAVFFDRLALADSLLTACIVWAFAFWLLAARYLRLDFAMLAGFGLGFAWLTKSPAVFALALSPSLALFIPRRTKRNLIIFASLLLVSWVIGLAMYNILRLGPEFHLIALRNQDYLYTPAEVLAHPFSPLLPHLVNVGEYWWYFLTPPGVLLAAWGLFDLRRRHLRERLILGAWIAVPVVAASAFAIALTARYLLYTVPFIAILIAHAADHIGERTQKHFLVYLAFVLVVVSSLWQSLAFIYSPQTAALPRGERSGYLEDWTAGYGLRQVAEYIRTQAASGRQIVVGAEGFFGTPFSALEMYLNGLPNVRVVGLGLQETSVPDKLVSASGDNQVFWVANSSRFSVADPARVGLNLINSYPKAVKSGSAREYTLFFEYSGRKP